MRKLVQSTTVCHQCRRNQHYAKTAEQGVKTMNPHLLKPPGVTEGDTYCLNQVLTHDPNNHNTLTKLHYTVIMILAGDRKYLIWLSVRKKLL